MSFIRYLKAYSIACFLVLAIYSSALATEYSMVSATNTQIPNYSRITSVELNRDYFIGYLTDTKNILTSPIRWNQTDWLEASLVTGFALGLYTQDDKIKAWVQENKNATTRHLADDATNIFALSVPALVGLGAYGYIYSDEKAKTTFLLSTESFVITGVFVQVLKHTTGRHRPYTGDSHDTWSGFTTKSSYLSFPSGDASSAFALATVVATEYDNKYVPPLVYGAATLIALERVHNNAHWSSDVFVASAIGYYTGKAVVASHTKQSRLSLSPMIDGKDRGVLISYRF
jgi:membrane-associated phospholipid phosphatase